MKRFEKYRKDIKHITLITALALFWGIFYPRYGFWDALHIAGTMKTEQEALLTDEDYRALFDWKTDEVEVKFALGKFFE